VGRDETVCWEWMGVKIGDSDGEGEDGGLDECEEEEEKSSSTESVGIKDPWFSSI
jgi:hypothetical protein